MHLKPMSWSPMENLNVGAPSSRKFTRKLAHPGLHSQPQLLRKAGCKADLWTPGPGRRERETGRHGTHEKHKIKLGMNRPPGDLPTSTTEKSSQRGNDGDASLEELPEASWVSPSLPDVLCVPPEGTNSCNHSWKSYVTHFKLQECRMKTRFQTNEVPST